jgi:predicted protein tyrosine phosphatase
LTNILFLCGKARMRSPTAAALVAYWPSIQSDYAGLSNDADEPVTLDHILWADDIYVMERRQKKRLNDLFAAHLRTKTIGVLNIPDIYNYMDPDLIDRLNKRLAPKYSP